MASKDTNSAANNDSLLTLHEMFHIVGDQMTVRDVKVLKVLYSAVLSRDYLEKIKDGFTFLVALEKIGRLDESNFKHILHLLRIINRHDLIPYLSMRRRQTVETDPVDEYLEKTARSNTIIPFKRKADQLHLSSTPGTSSSSRTGDASSQASASSTSSSSSSSSPPSGKPTTTSSWCHNQSPDSSPPAKRLRRSSGQSSYGRKSGAHCKNADIQTKRTCDIRLRVRAEYCQHDSALEGNVHSNKPELVERQFEKFMQANTILKSRDLGSIICDIKFSELTYLDAFWRDYINGSLLDALKGVFITESLKQAVGHEAIKLLVNVDEDDYEKGRLILLSNLTQ